MAGRHVATGMPAPKPRTGPAGSGGGKHVAPPRPLVSVAQSVAGSTRDAMSSSSLLGSAIPKGILAPALGANHAGAMNDLTVAQSGAQQGIESTLAGLDATAKARSIAATFRGAEANPPSSTALTVDSPRLMAHGRGPRVSVMGLTEGDLDRVVSEWDRFGYTVGRAMVPPRLDVMSSRSYWQFDSPVILGSMPASARAAMVAAFTRGTTVWTSVAAIGTHTENNPRPGVGY